MIVHPTRFSRWLAGALILAGALGLSSAKAQEKVIIDTDFNVAG